MTNVTIDTLPLSRKDFVSDQDVRWCPGCGDYAVLAQVQKILPEIGLRKENIVCISGIGCASRFPYYLEAYGIHSIHGRAPTIATGLKVTNPDLSIWVVTGDGDALSIGGNHLLHACRRNVDINIILFNNQVYGLTKGQYSPTSPAGTKTKSSPMGSIEQPLNPISVAISAEATFVARSVDVHTKHLQEVLRAAASHVGTSFIEVYQNCPIFNDGVWDHVTDAKVKAQNILPIEHGKPMVFGREQDRGLRLNGLEPEVVHLNDGVTEDELLVHDQFTHDPHLAFLLSRLSPPDFPTPLGIFRQVQRETHSESMLAQIEAAVNQKGKGDLQTLYFAAETWTVEEETRQTPDNPNRVEMTDGIDDAYLDGLGNALPEASAIKHSLETHTLADLDPGRPITVTADTTLAEVVRIMRANTVGAVLVVGQLGILKGVFTERDALTKVACQINDLETTPVRQCMTPNPTSLRLDTPIAHAIHLMAVHAFRHIPVVGEAGKLVGVISFRDVVRFIKSHLAPEGS